MAAEVPKILSLSVDLEETRLELVLGKRDWKYGQTCFVTTTVNRRNTFRCVKWVPLLISSFLRKRKKLYEICSQLSWRNTLGKLSVPLLVPDAFSRTQTVVDIRFAISCDRMRSHAIACDRMRFHAIAWDRMGSHAIAYYPFLREDWIRQRSHSIAWDRMRSHEIACDRMRSHAFACDRMRSHEIANLMSTIVWVLENASGTRSGTESLLKSVSSRQLWTDFI